MPPCLFIHEQEGRYNVFCPDKVDQSEVTYNNVDCYKFTTIARNKGYNYEYGWIPFISLHNFFVPKSNTYQQVQANWEEREIMKDNLDHFPLEDIQNNNYIISRATMGASRAFIQSKVSSQDIIKGD